MRLLTCLTLAAIVLAGCAAQPFTTHYAEPLPGFWWGLLHGFIAPFSLMGSFFNPEIRAYAAPNSGWWYDLRFAIGLFSIGGSSSVAR
jgi:hypothetical protein